MRGAGLELRYYEPGPALEPDPEGLERLLTPRARALYLIHHLGFPQDARTWRHWARERGLLLIEDVAQAWRATIGGRPAGSFGDGAVFAPHLTFGLRDGAIGLLGDGRDWAGAPPSGSRWDPRLAAQRLVERIVDDGVAPKRRANYEQLLSELGDRVSAPFDRLSEGAVPLAFAIEDSDPTGLRTRLAAHGIFASDPWSLAEPSPPNAAFVATALRRRSTLALPVHQHLRPVDLERIVTVVTGRPRRPTPVRTEIHHDLDALRDEWDDLALASANVFATREWLGAWWRHYGNDGRLLVSAVRDPGGRLLAILPLYVWRERPLRILRFLGHGPGDQLGPICAPADRVIVAREIRRCVAAGSWGSGMVLGDHLAGADGWGARLGARTLRWTSSPVLRFGAGGWSGFLADRSANFRSQLGRRERRLAGEHELRFRLTGPDTVSADMDRLLELHRARRPQGSSFTAREPFHRETTALLARRGWLRLWLLELDGVARAAWYGTRFAGVESFYQSGRDPSAKQSLGLVLLAHTIREAGQDGISEYRHLRGAEGYKYRFATHDPGLETLAMSNGPAAGAAATGAALIPRALQRRIRAA